MRKQNNGNEKIPSNRRCEDPHNINRSQLFWSGVNAVRNIQKSSQCDSYNFIASNESRRRHLDETEGKVRGSLDIIRKLRQISFKILRLISPH